MRWRWRTWTSDAFGSKYRRLSARHRPPLSGAVAARRVVRPGTLRARIDRASAGSLGHDRRRHLHPDPGSLGDSAFLEDQRASIELATILDDGTDRIDLAVELADATAFVHPSRIRGRRGCGQARRRADADHGREQKDHL